MIAALAFLLLSAQAPSPQTPASQTPPKPATATPNDPASSVFSSEAGVLLVLIKQASVPDYELAIRTLNEALAKDPDPARREAVKGWRVFRALEPDAKGNAVFVHVMLPAASGFDYRPSMLLDKMVTDLPPEILSKYQEAFAGPPSKLTLTEIANMTLAPVAPAEKKPGGR